MIRLLIIAITLLSVYTGNSQDYFRIKTDFMIKGKASSGEQQLTVGKIYYDKNIKKIVFDISFPEKEIWIQKDTNLYKIVNGLVTDKQKTPSIVDFTIYNLALNGSLSDFGLKKTNFKIIDIEKEGNSIYTTWEPPKELKELYGNVIIQNTDQKLTGIIFKNKDDIVVGRQFFKKYINIKGLAFPTEIIRETTINDKKIYEITTFSNIVVNEFTSDDKYDFKIPRHK